MKLLALNNQVDFFPEKEIKTSRVLIKIKKWKDMKAQLKS